MSKAGLFSALLALPTLLLASSGPAIPAGQPPAMLALSQPAAAEDVVHYIVQPGETLLSIAARGFENPANWKLAAKFNSLPEGAALRAGAVLALRMEWLKTTSLTATIETWRGDVTVRDAVGPRSLYKGLPVREGDLVSTAANSFVTLRLPDGSQVSLPSASAIRANRLRFVVLTASVDRRFRLEQGSSDTRVTPMANKSSRFIISTPVAAAAVRGTEYRVTFTPGTGTQTTGVTEGKVQVYRATGAAQDMTLPRGFGGVVSARGAQGPVALLSAPKIAALPGEKQGELISIRLKPQAGAVGYRVELATDAGFADRMAIEEVPAAGGGEAVASFTDIQPGIIHVRVAAIDRLGLSGLPATAQFERDIDPEMARADHQAEQRRQMAELGTEDSQSAPWYGAGSALDAMLLETVSETSAGGDLAEVPESFAAFSADAGAWVPIGSSARAVRPSSQRPGGGGFGGGSGGGGGGVAVIPQDPAPPAPAPGGEDPSDNSGNGGQGAGNGAEDATVVPEAPVWLLLIAGFGLVGTMLRRNRLAVGGQRRPIR